MMSKMTDSFRWAANSYPPAYTIAVQMYTVDIQIFNITVKMYTIAVQIYNIAAQMYTITIQMYTIAIQMRTITIQMYTISFAIIAYFNHFGRPEHLLYRGSGELRT